VAGGAWPTIGKKASEAITKQIARESCGAACAVTLLGSKEISQEDVVLQAMSPNQLAARMNAL
jgi:hypothetical protein